MTDNVPSFMFQDAEAVDNSDVLSCDDEFFDTLEQHDDQEEASGIHRPLIGLTGLLSQQPLMEPYTQAGVPMTEDVAKQQQEILARLGVSPESALLRQQIQSTSLVSDMQAFKAANRGACLADFVRWYSPRDWISFEKDQEHRSLEEEGRHTWWFPNHGMLSERMRSSTNLWHRMWQSSPSVPVARQKRLFDPVQESEKLFHYLETMSPHEMLHQMLVGAISSVCCTLENALEPHVSSLVVIQTQLNELYDRGNHAIQSLDNALEESQAAYALQKQPASPQTHGALQVAFEMALDACWKFVFALEQTEGLMTQALALMHYLGIDNTSLQFIESLLKHMAVELKPLDPLRQSLAHVVLENPSSQEPMRREYILRCICPRPFLREYEQRYDEEEEEEEDLSPLVVSRMYAAFLRQTVRFAFSLSESEF